MPAFASKEEELKFYLSLQNPKTGAFMDAIHYKLCHKLQNATNCVILRQKSIGGPTMTTAVRVSGELVKEAKIYSKIDKRSITGQIEHWARIGKCAEENQDLTYSLIKEILIGIAELDQGESSEYRFG